MKRQTWRCIQHLFYVILKTVWGQSKYKYISLSHSFTLIHTLPHTRQLASEHTYIHITPAPDLDVKRCNNQPSTTESSGTFMIKLYHHGIWFQKLFKHRHREEIPDVLCLFAVIILFFMLLLAATVTQASVSDSLWTSLNFIMTLTISTITYCICLST